MVAETTPGSVLHQRPHSLSERVGLVDMQAPRWSLSELADAFDDARFGPGADAPELAQASVSGRRLQLGERGDPERAPDLACRSRSHAGDRQQLQEGRGHFSTQCLVVGQASTGDQLCDAFTDAAPDTTQPRWLALAVGQRHLDTGAGDRIGSAAIGTDLER